MAADGDQTPPPRQHHHHQPKDSIKSTWRFDDRRHWTIHHWILDLLNAHHYHADQPIPVHQKTDKMPYISQWSMHLWILVHAAIPLALHQAYVSSTNTSMPSTLVALHYGTFFLVIVLRQLEQLRRLGHAHGFLDGDQHPRDGIPNSGVTTVLFAGVKTAFGRLAMTTLLTYSPASPPLATITSPRWLLWLPVQISLYGITLDFFFYWYHRAMHAIPPLWTFHRRHHLTKHPNPALAPYADQVQEGFDMVLIPLLTYLTLRGLSVPLDFYAWWFCHQYIAFTEFGGHSGLRVQVRAPSPVTWLLALCDAELVIEDHDLHHRYGWRVSHNYGKQTRVWDRVFGTTRARVEMTPENVDPHGAIHVSLL